MHTNIQKQECIVWGNDVAHFPKTIKEKNEK